MPKSIRVSAQIHAKVYETLKEKAECVRFGGSVGGLVSHILTDWYESGTKSPQNANECVNPKSNQPEGEDELDKIFG